MADLQFLHNREFLPQPVLLQRLKAHHMRQPSRTLVGRAAGQAPLTHLGHRPRGTTDVDHLARFRQPRHRPPRPRHRHWPTHGQQHHEIAQTIVPESRIVYVDNDPIGRGHGGVRGGGAIATASGAVAHKLGHRRQAIHRCDLLRPTLDVSPSRIAGSIPLTSCRTTASV